MRPGIIFFSRMCVYVHICLVGGGPMYVWENVWRPQIDVESLSFPLSTLSIETEFLNFVWSSLLQLGCLASLPQGSQVRITGGYHAQHLHCLGGPNL